MEKDLCVSRFSSHVDCMNLLWQRDLFIYKKTDVYFDSVGTSIHLIPIGSHSVLNFLFGFFGAPKS